MVIRRHSKRIQLVAFLTCTSKSMESCQKKKEQIKAMEAKGKDTTELKNNGLDDQARRYFKAMCDNDTRAIALWRRFRGQHRTICIVI